MKNQGGFTFIEGIVLIAAIGTLSFFAIKSIQHPVNVSVTGSSTTTVSVQSVPIPSPAGYVNDEATVLSKATVEQNEKKLATFASAGSGEVSVLVVPSLNGLPITEFGNGVLETWKGTKYGITNGNILIISTGDQKAIIEMGASSTITWIQASNILETTVLPNMQKTDWNRAVNDGVDAMIHTMVTN